jgi:hypothetical protein
LKQQIFSVLSILLRVENENGNILHNFIGRLRFEFKKSNFMIKMKGDGRKNGFSMLCAIVAILILTTNATEDRCSPVRTLLVGWIGDGKTSFCNKYDGTTCGFIPEQPSEYADTSSVYLGNHFADSLGFGENRVEDDQQSLSGSAYAMSTTLIGINGTDLRAVLWLVPCAEHRTKLEAIASMRAYMDMIGSEIPLVAIFNPASPHNACVKDRSSFLQVTREHGVNVRDVIHFDDFNLASFNDQFSEVHPILLPPVEIFHSFLEGQDPRVLAAKLKMRRELKCESIPSELSAVRGDVDSTRSELRSEGEVPGCSKSGSCDHISLQGLENCDRSSCGEWGKTCSRTLSVKHNCNTFCKRYDHFQDGDCLARNQQKQDLYNSQYKACQDDIQTAYNTCAEHRDQAIAALQSHNTAVSSRLDTLLEKERVLVDKSNRCGDI